MLDIDLIRQDPRHVEENLERRRHPPYVALLKQALEVDTEWRRLHGEADRLRAQRNRLSQALARAHKSGTPPPEEVSREARELPAQIEALELREKETARVRDDLLRRLPNLLDPSVPFGTDDTGNVEVSRWGEPVEPGFPLRSHGDLAEAMGWAEFGQARDVSGAGFYYLLGDLALLDLALQRFAVDRLVQKGFVPVVPPYMLRREPYEGVTDLADFEKVMYRVEGEDLYLIATSEHPLAALYRGKILEETSLPIRLAGISQNFRREIGGHGVDQKGIFRVHQFSKVEQFVFCAPEDSPKVHEELRANAEEFFRALEIPYRVVNVCTGDLGVVAAKKYDIEAWFPRQKAYREVVSCSNCKDYQARRLGIRMGKAGKPGKRVPHTLNSTEVATSRAMAVILEGGQAPDGTVRIPRVLIPYMGGRERLEPRNEIGR